jgi:D-amino-acid oxidase
MRSVTINVPKYLKWLLSMFRAGGGVVEVRALKHIQEAAKDDVDVVVNCTGFGWFFFGAFWSTQRFAQMNVGAKFLGGVEDSAVFPTRGQTILVKAPFSRYTITRMAGNVERTHAPRPSVWL